MHSTTPLTFAVRRSEIAMRPKNVPETARPVPRIPFSVASMCAALRPAHAISQRNARDRALRAPQTSSQTWTRSAAPRTARATFRRHATESPAGAPRIPCVLRDSSAQARPRARRSRCATVPIRPATSNTWTRPRCAAWPQGNAMSRRLAREIPDLARPI